MDLSRNKLTNLTIPANNTYERLDASYNRLTSGSIQSPLPKLKILNLKSNDITSFSIGSRGTLERLYLSYNELSNGGTDGVPAVWMSGQSFPQLEMLRLSGNKHDTLTFNSNQVPRLIRLHVDNNKDKKFATARGDSLYRIDIRNLSRLTYLDVRINNALQPTRDRQGR